MILDQEQLKNFLLDSNILSEDGIVKAVQGITTIEEVLRVIRE